VRNVGVAERNGGREGEARPSPQARMGQLVDEDEITRTNDCRDDAEISEIA
jgi:hypothetical protein